MTDYRVTKENAEVTVNNALDEIESLIDSGVVVKLSVTKTNRSLSQNALLHMWISEISKHLIKDRDYCTPEWVKQALKATFLGSEQVTSIDVLSGQKITTTEIRHSSKLDKGEMTFFLERIQQWALDINLILTAPVDSDYFKFLEKQVQ